MDTASICEMLAIVCSRGSISFTVAVMLLKQTVFLMFSFSAILKSSFVSASSARSLREGRWVSTLLAPNGLKKKPLEQRSM